MISPAHFRVLRRIHRELTTPGVNWVVTAGMNLALRAMPVDPHDIDTQTDETGAYEIERLFAEFVTKEVAPCSTEQVQSHFGEPRIHEIRVDIMGDVQKCSEDTAWRPPPNLNQYKEFVEYGGLPVPVLSMEYEYQAYLRLGRTEKARMLKELLERKRNT